MMKHVLIYFLLSCMASAVAQDSTTIKVHFLYGSKPLRKYKDTEEKWFGGMLGGHAGIESDSNKILNFLPNGGVHIFSRKKNKNSRYGVHRWDGFYSILGGDSDSAKKCIIHIPVSRQQRHIFDSLFILYTYKSPYDYAFFGMRCGAATYEILAQMQILPEYRRGKLVRRIFYPKKLRHLLLSEARIKHWKVEREAGSVCRKWETD